jgi:transposase
MTAEQQRETLQKAAAARRERTRALAGLKNGNVTLAAVLDDKENPLQRAFVRQVLRALPGIGAVTADRIMTEIGIDARRRIAGLGTRQRAELVAALA